MPVISCLQTKMHKNTILVLHTYSPRDDFPTVAKKLLSCYFWNVYTAKSIGKWAFLWNKVKAIKTKFIRW